MAGSSSEISPRSTRIISAQAVTGLVIDARRKIESASTGWSVLGLRWPAPRAKTSLPCRATVSEAALIWPASTAAVSRPKARSSCAADMPTAAGSPVCKTVPSVVITFPFFRI